MKNSVSIIWYINCDYCNALQLPSSHHRGTIPAHPVRGRHDDDLKSGVVDDVKALHIRLRVVIILLETQAKHVNVMRCARQLSVELLTMQICPKGQM